ncbi:MAG: metallophosphoesterase [bacterium JZ-2024 1]
MGYIYPRADFVEACATALIVLQAPLGVFFILGNRDYWTDPEWIAKELQKAGFTLLKNRSVKLTYRGEAFYLVGLDCVTAGSPDPVEALSAVPPDAFVVLAVHEPDFAETLKHRRLILQVSGHTHGGQVVIPWFGPPVLPRMRVAYPLGLQTGEGSGNYVHTKRGIGMSGLPIRLFCPPGVTLLTLRASSATDSTHTIMERRPINNPLPRIRGDHSKNLLFFR